MNFKENRPIYMQIADRIADDVLSGIFKSDERIPSVREYAAMVEVNANTVVRSYDYLQQKGVIYNRRGLGYFVAPDAVKIVHDIRREQLLGDELNQMMRQLASIGISPDELREMYAKYLQNNK
ncbi:MAG: GntR family transcriptional regulator [Muribaculaceae bacterium]